MNINYQYIILLAFLLGCSSKNDNEFVISINNENILFDHFFKYHNQEKFFNSNGVIKEKIIDDFIMKKIIIKESTNKDIHKNLNIYNGEQYFSNRLIEDAILEEKVWKPILTDESLQKTYYNLNRTIALRHIVIQHSKSIKSKTNRSKLDALKLIEKIKQEIESGKITFANAARKYSEDRSALESGDLGYAKWGKLFEPIQTLAFNLKLREMSDPIESRFGYHIVFVYAMKTINLPSFNNYKPILKKFIRSNNSPEYSRSISNYENYLINKYDIKYIDNNLELLFNNLKNNSKTNTLVMRLIMPNIDYNADIIVTNQNHLDIDWLKNELKIGSLVTSASINSVSDLKVNIKDIMFRYLARLEKGSLPLDTMLSINQRSFNKYYEVLIKTYMEKYNLKNISFYDSLIQRYKIKINKSLFEM